MKIARVVGTVTLSRGVAGMAGARLRAVETLESIEELDRPRYGGDLVVGWDLCGASVGDQVALAEGPEAAQPFQPDIKPLDASIVALLDHLDIDDGAGEE